MWEMKTSFKLGREEKGILYPSKHITIYPAIAKATQAPRKSLISLKVDYADLKLDMSILFPAKLRILSEGHKFLFYDYDDAKQF